MGRKTHFVLELKMVDTAVINRERKTMAILLVKADLRIVEWLTSNPVGEVYKTETPVMGLSFKTKRSEGFRRWPIVPEQQQPS